MMTSLSTRILSVGGEGQHPTLNAPARVNTQHSTSCAPPLPHPAPHLLTSTLSTQPPAMSTLNTRPSAGTQHSTLNQPGRVNTQHSNTQDPGRAVEEAAAAATVSRPNARQTCDGQDVGLTPGRPRTHSSTEMGSNASASKLGRFNGGGRS